MKVRKSLYSIDYSTPTPFKKRPIKAEEKLPRLRSNIPATIRKQPIYEAGRNLFRLPNPLVRKVPTSDPENWAGKNSEVWRSLRWNLADRIGKTCPIKTVVIPEIKNATWRNIFRFRSVEDWRVIKTKLTASAVKVKSRFGGTQRTLSVARTWVRADTVSEQTKKQLKPSTGLDFRIIKTFVNILNQSQACPRKPHSSRSFPFTF